MLSVVAAGNDGPTRGTILSPAGAPWVLTVGASSRRGTEFQEAIAGELARPAWRVTTCNARPVLRPPLRDEGPMTAPLVLVDDGIVDFWRRRLGTTYDACEPLTNAAEVQDNVALLQRGACDFRGQDCAMPSGRRNCGAWLSIPGDPVVMDGTRGSQYSCGDDRRCRRPALYSTG